MSLLENVAEMSMRISRTNTSD